MQRIRFFFNFQLVLILFFNVIIGQNYNKNNVNKKNKANSGRVYNLAENKDYLYKNPEYFTAFKQVPSDFVDYFKITFKKEKTPQIIGILGLTALMVAYDQQLIDGAKKIGKKLKIPATNKMARPFHIFGLPIETPHDLGTSLYYLGDGWTQASIMTSFFTAGLIKKDSRALQTASQLFEGLICTTIASQFLKHITGRESPFVATAPGGKWRPFPDQVKYHHHVPHYDAYPSGHLATVMMTFTVITENYPKQKWIKPFGYTWMTLLGFQMMNNGVHWISDYPLAIAMGYSFGKIIVNKGRKKVTRFGQVDSKKYNFQINPSVLYNSFGLSAKLSF